MQSAVVLQRGIMGNWEKVFNRKPTLRCNATVVKGRLIEPVSLKRGGLLFAIFLLKSSTAFLSGDDCMSLFWRHLSVCVSCAVMSTYAVMGLPLEHSVTTVLQNPNTRSCKLLGKML